MNKNSKKICILTLTMILCSLFISMSKGETSSQTNVESKSLTILSTVFNFDLSRYNVVLNGSSVDFVSTFGPNVKEQIVDYTLSNYNSQISVNLVFENGHLWYCNVHSVKGTPVYNQAIASDAVSLSKGLMQRYQTYIASNDPFETSYVPSMANMLNSISSLNSPSVIANNTKLVASVISDSSNNNSAIYGSLTWLYTIDGLDVPRKAFSLNFENGNLKTISDTWNLVSIGSPVIVSQNRALGIAWSAAQNLKLRLSYDNGTIAEITPNLSNITTRFSVSMVTRNSTALYPLWQVNYFFNQTYERYYGIQVGVWGDSGDIFYCKSLGTLGNIQQSGPDSSNPQPEGSTDYWNYATPTVINQKRSQTDLSVPILVSVVALAVVLATVGIIVKKRRKS